MHAFPPNHYRTRLNALLLGKPYDYSDAVKRILDQKPQFIAYPVGWPSTPLEAADRDLLVDTARRQGYHDAIAIDDIRILRRGERTGK